MQLFQEPVTLQERAFLWQLNNKINKNEKKQNNAHKATSAARACGKARKDTARGEMARPRK